MRRRALAGVAVAVAAAVSGCSFSGVGSLPLPGGVNTGSNPYTVNIQFSNVLDLVPQSECRVNDVPVGMITNIRLDGWTAMVTCRLRRSVVLPANSVAAIDQTSLLGEKYVALSAPAGTSSQGTLKNGATIPLARTTESAQVEDVLGALSLLVTGGGLQQISTITTELNNALAGHTDQWRDLLNQLNVFVGGLNSQKNQIINAIQQVDALSSTLARNNQTITSTIDTTEPAVGILASQRGDLTKLLVSLGTLGNVATQTIQRSKSDTLSNLRSLQTILNNTNRVGSIIPKILGGFFTFPFPQTVSNAVRGDYGNLFATLDLNVANIEHNFFEGTPLQGLADATQKLEALLAAPRTSLPTTPLGVLPSSNLNGGGSSGTSGTSGTSSSNNPLSNLLGMPGEQGDNMGGLLTGGTS